ncbi:MAG TPA: potassium transporter TrkG [Chloroflexota bacterium]|nr:potassium transporter TrkG [Chloroflexota bacterium]
MKQIRAMARRLSPIQLLVLGFVLLSLVGALLLTLPVANSNGRSQPFLDALFMSVSAVSTTGLAVVHVGGAYTLFGQLVVLALVQIGGLGYMTLILFVIYIAGGTISYQSGHLMTESMAMPSRGEMRAFVRRIIKVTLLFEGVGALALTLYWMPAYGWLEAAYLGLFHAISAFCTAGIMLFADGFVAYQSDWLFNGLVNVIAFAGGVGFFVLSDGYNALRRLLRRQAVYRLTTHSKLALLTSTGLVVGGTAVLFWLNYTLAVPWPTHFLTASFQALSASSTTGFNTVDLAQWRQTSLLILIVLMFIGAPAGGTGGGIKSTTFGVILLILWAVLRHNRDVNAFGRRIPRDTLVKGVAVAMTAVIWLAISSILLTLTEPAAQFLDILFESASALGTVGLSTGLTPDLSSGGKVVVILTMLVGRVGPLGVMFSLFGRPSTAAYRYPQEEVFVG